MKTSRFYLNWLPSLRQQTHCSSLLCCVHQQVETNPHTIAEHAHLQYGPLVAEHKCLQVQKAERDKKAGIKPITVDFHCTVSFITMHSCCRKLQDALDPIRYIDKSDFLFLNTGLQVVKEAYNLVVTIPLW